MCVTTHYKKRHLLSCFSGPEVMALGEAARVWKRARSVRKSVVNVPLFGGLAAGFRTGHNTVPEGEQGVVRWEEWLRGAAGKDF